ncbi:MAG TPA: SAM-dependent chlorinase/fluorinase [Gemmatimonadaceae bacterium]|nr:SAM-dependent chlorinase/fluorinase [Gemmatimonadaceae bacterium]
MRRILLACALAIAVAVAPAAHAQSNPKTLLFLTDFGVRDGAVAVCKGVMWDVLPDLRIVDLTHENPPYDVQTAGEVLEQAVPFYPSGTVAVAVVDPGVGSERKPIAIRTRAGHLLVGPDNGMFTLIVDREGLDRAVELRNVRYFRDARTSFTFHGRDIFSPVGAHLAAGVPLDSLGPSITPVRLNVRAARIASGRVEGTVRYVEDPYGNVVANVPAALLDSIASMGDSIDVMIGTRRLRLPWRSTFSDVKVGASLVVIHSRGLVSFSVNQGDFAKRYGIKRGDAVVLRNASRR